MSEDRIEITVYFKDGEFPRDLVLNRAGREIDCVTVDGERLESVVRCRDCAYLNIIGKCPCGFWALEDLDGFCSWAERRTE